MNSTSPAEWPAFRLRWSRWAIVAVLLLATGTAAPANANVGNGLQEASVESSPDSRGIGVATPTVGFSGGRKCPRAGLPFTGLADAARRCGVDLGVQVVESLLGIPEYTSALRQDYTSMLIDGELRWGPDRWTEDFAKADRMVNFAANNGMPVQVHHLIWGYEPYLPDWLLNGGFSKDEVLSIMRDHIRVDMQHFTGKVAVWSVVNEASYGSGYIDNFWLRTIGPSYIDYAFKYAREADSTVVLIYNDNSNELLNPQSDHVLQIAQQLKREGDLIDGVGMQMHIDAAKPPLKSEVLENMRRFGAAGIAVYVTEFDVDLSKVGGTRADGLKLQARIYQDMLEACLESGACKSFSVFGLTDRYSYLYERRGADPLPLDIDYKRKPAFEAMRSILAPDTETLPGNGTA